MKKYLIEAIEKEKTALDALSAMSLQECERVMAAIEECKGKVVFCGVGKSAHIGAKLAATFASLGIPSFFVHATESVHGDRSFCSAVGTDKLPYHKKNRNQRGSCFRYLIINSSQLHGFP